LEKDQNVKVEIYSITGRKIKTLANNNQSSGDHLLTWNGTDDNNNKIPLGFYFFRINSEEFNYSGKLILNN
jgi:flagellar hook assembly protein FlgD